ncbi:MAG: molybdenum cofactor biosynthesis protein B [Nitrospira sp. SB0672_bin_25]|nr:molybdenum cofactor biosynthesis protein B [Nitrospira sp. SB0666_bin_27]MYC26483.1 molybdenum cofactor biosynthesis protein B [Nitrospira sp. SB0662_bin_26]MYF25467.1 molybdenum cofactor biosynthesis protein B [Nitrospira sp. SB0678_bin_10]MYJ53390.1 molybdenum cofactor biosynthesis protein B [Nitrospira sp. SB0672_bin_25]
MSQADGATTATADLKRAGLSVAVAVLTVSDSRTIETDTSGSTIVDRLMGAGHRVADRKLCPDEYETIRETIAAWVADPAIEFVIVTGGTGVTQRDVTPEAVRSLFSKPIPGFGELFRWLSYREIRTSTIQSRADAGVCGDTIVFLLPGSTGACRLGMEQIILPQLDIDHRPCNLTELLPRVKEERPPVHGHG